MTKCNTKTHSICLPCNIFSILVIIQFLCLHNVMVLHVASYDGPGRYFLRHECGDQLVSSSEMLHIRDLLTQLKAGAATSYPVRFVLNSIDFQGAAHCPGPKYTFSNYGPPRGKYAAHWLEFLCFRCLHHIMQHMLDEFCWMNAEAKYASTECVITYKYFPNGNKDDVCDNSWPPQLYPYKEHGALHSPVDQLVMTRRQLGQLDDIWKT